MSQAIANICMKISSRAFLLHANIRSLHQEMVKKIIIKKNQNHNILLMLPVKIKSCFLYLFFISVLQTIPFHSGRFTLGNQIFFAYVFLSIDIFHMHTSVSDAIIFISSTFSQFMWYVGVSSQQQQQQFARRKKKYIYFP